MVARQLKHWREQTHQRATHRYRRFLAIIIALLIIISASWAVWLYLPTIKTMSLDKISWRINNPYPINIKPELQTSIAEQLSKNYFAIDLQQLRLTLEQQPWVDKAYIKRLLINDLHIDVFLHRIALRFNDSGYITTKGLLIKPTPTINTNKPLALGKASAVKSIYDNYQRYQKILSTIGAQISVIEQRQVTNLMLDSHTYLKLGYQQQEARLKRFVKHYPALVARNKINFHTIDLRYQQGFAISAYP